MSIPYSKKLYRKELCMGFLFLILGIFFVRQEPENIFKYGFILISVLHFISGIYQLQNPYLKVENGTITKSGLFSRKIALADVERIKLFAGDYTLFTSDKKLKINTEFLDNSQKKELDEFMRSLEIPLDETPPKKFKYS